MKTTRLLTAFGFGVALCAGSSAFAATPKNHHDTAKGAAAGAAVGHEVGSGHAVAGAGTGAAIGHHKEKKAEKNGG